MFTYYYYYYNELVAWRHHANAVELRLRRVYGSNLRLPLFLPFVRKDPLTHDIKFCHEILESSDIIYHVVKARSFYLTWS